jgi:hypothetical protein
MAQFSKRHYQAIAQAMQNAKEAADLESHDVAMAFVIIETAIGDVFVDDNSLFNRALFLQACQPGANVRARKVA